MTFIQGFEKVALAPNPNSLGHAVGKVLGKGKKFIAADVKQTAHNFRQRAANIKGGLAEGANGARKNVSSGLQKQPIGGHLTDVRTDKITAGRAVTDDQKSSIRNSVSGQTKQDILERAQKLKEFKNKKSHGPSFAARHPIATGVGAAVTAKYLMSNNNQQSGQFGAYPTNPVSPY